MIGYSTKLKDHFINPRNVGVLPDATVVGEVGSLSSGQAMKLYLKLDGDEIVTHATFQVFGSPSSIAAASALTEMVKGRKIDDVARITSKDISEYLGGLPPERMHTCVLAMEALEVAYARLRGIDLESELDEDEEFHVCRCYSVPEHKIERAIRDHNLTDIQGITHYTKAGGGCTSCHADLKAILARVHAEKPAEEKKPAAAPSGNKPAFSNLELAHKIQEVLDREIRPGLAMDGGDMELVDIRDNKVFVQLHGHCNSCSASQATMKFFVQDRLREMVDPNLEVIDTTDHGAELHAPPMR
ncbi:MAG: Fe-S cluster assembly protein NifU [Planctomycetes bacterium]|nr:Fe-S cluster assembly protein NifU [Planctomycetota bacterium]MCW8136650.1 Fe-S cluster assembly protein NifU [Planctomycetota bacterium]